MSDDIYLINRVINNESCVVLTDNELDKLIAKFPLTHRDVIQIKKQLQVLGERQNANLKRVIEDQIGIIDNIKQVETTLIKLINNMDLNERLKKIEESNKNKPIERDYMPLWIGLTIISLITAIVALFSVKIGL